jgi:hypothetical protein
LTRVLKKSRYSFWLVLAALSCHTLSAQNPDDENIPEGILQPETEATLPSDTVRPAPAQFTIRHIILTGNKKTKPDIILREIPFRAGEQYSMKELVQKFEDARKQLMNTTLFHEVIVALKNTEGYKIDVAVDVRERWYIFPVPYFKPVDRNLNQWIFEQNTSLSRVNYGIKLLWYNTTGRNDKLRFWFITGYTKQFSFSYDRLYIDRQMKWGINLGFATGKNREVNYNTIDDKQVFLKDNNYVRSFVNTYAELTYRRAIKTRHRFGVGYTKENVSDTVVALNPAYFKSGRKSIQFPELYYSMSYFDLDYNAYPTKGYAAEVMLSKKGFNNEINAWQASVKGLGSWYVLPKTFLSVRGYGAIKLPFKQPYFNLRFLGYNEVFMQGYEYYVVDGVAGGYLKASLTRQLVGFNVRVPGRKGRPSFHVPFRVYGKIYGNTGYVHNPQPGDNFLSNTMLYSGGLGLDIFTFYDFTLKFEWSFNQLGQNGLFLHNKSIF